MSSAYEEIEQHQKKLGHLQHLAKILNWDEETMMPVGAGADRMESMSTLSLLLHRTKTEPKVGDLIQKAKTESQNLDAWQKRNLEMIEKSFRLSSLLPADLVERKTRASMTCQQAWRKLRAENDYKSLEPLLHEVVAVTRETSQILADDLGLSPYDALLDQYEEGLRQSTIDPLFDELQSFLPDFVDQVIDKQKSQRLTKIKGPFEVAQQEAASRELMKAIGFDFDRGRLDVSTHPFCGGDPSDVRITTRYDLNDFSSALMGVLHETGHALYEQNLPAKWRRQPVGQSRGMSLHESQSLFLEMQICRSPSFLKFAQPVLAKHLASKDTHALAYENLVTLYSRVQKSLIRVDADEVTYPLHIILRYRIEKDLIANKLSTKELPERWNSEMQSLLGVTTKGNDKDGVMQDVHWPWGAYGYFPSYSLGAMIAAQLFAQLQQNIPDALGRIEHGDFSFLVKWLRENIHDKASSQNSWQIIKEVTGQDLTAKSFIDHLKQRYG